MNFQEYKKSWIDADYQNGIDNISEAKSLLDGTFKIRGDKTAFTIEHLNRLLPAIIEGVKHENKNKPKATPAIDFALDNLGRIKRLSMDNSGTKAAMQLRINYEMLYCALPAFSSVEPMMPAIQGSTSFIAMAEETIRRLPKSIKQKIQDVIIIQTDTANLYGVALAARKKCIHILSGNSNPNIKNTLLHEIGHCVLGHIDGQQNITEEQREKEAESFASKYNQA